MKIELITLISVGGICTSIYFGLSGFRRNQKSDDKQEASETTSMIVKMENIGNGVNEIKSDIKSIRDENKESRERLIIVEQSAKQAHKRIDKIEKIEGAD